MLEHGGGRGINSTENEVTPLKRFLNRFRVEPSGPQETDQVPARCGKGDVSFTSFVVGAIAENCAICRGANTSARSATIFAPFARSPGPDSLRRLRLPLTTTSKPALVRFEMAAGTAPRDDLRENFARTPTIMKNLRFKNQNSLLELQ